MILIVDEINRADIARVFGDLLYALEYRDAPVRRSYTVDGDTSITLPSNLIPLGTMNSADRSIALIDYSLRRRFTVIDLEPDGTVIDGAVSGLFTTADNNAALATSATQTSRRKLKSLCSRGSPRGNQPTQSPPIF